MAVFQGGWGVLRRPRLEAEPAHLRDPFQHSAQESKGHAQGHLVSLCQSQFEGLAPGFDKHGLSLLEGSQWSCPASPFYRDEAEGPQGDYMLSDQAGLGFGLRGGRPSALALVPAAPWGLGLGGR